MRLSESSPVQIVTHVYPRRNGSERLSNLPRITENIDGGTGVRSRFRGSWKLIQFGEPSKKKNTKRGKKMSIYLG